MNVNRRTRMVFVSAAVVAAVAVSVTQRRWWAVVDLAYLGIIAIVLAPGFLAVRQLVNPRDELAVSWARVLLAPAILRAAVGSAAHAATMWQVAPAQQRASIERLTVPLLVPDLPGYTIGWVTQQRAATACMSPCDRRPARLARATSMR